MNDLKKKRIKASFKYTWPIYIIIPIIVTVTMIFAFRLTHKAPGYKTLTLFVTGEVIDDKKLKDDIVSKYQDKGLKDVSFIDSDPIDPNYYSKLTIPGYNSADILIIPISFISKLDVSDFSIEITSKMINDYYQGYTFYQQDDVNYGIKIDREKVKEYMAIPTEDCYMFLNGRSENIGEYSKKPILEHDVALNVVKDWGK